MTAKIRTYKRLRREGFTLIEVLITVTIIGTLASVVMGSLNSARQKAVNSAIQSSFVTARNEAELVYDTNRSYATVCDETAVATSIADKTNSYNCVDSATAWAMEAESLGGNFFCVDTSGSVVTASESRIGDGDFICGPSSSEESGSGGSGVSALFGSMNYGGSPFWDASGNHVTGGGGFTFRDSSNSSLGSVSLDSDISVLESQMTALLDAGTVTLTWDFGANTLDIEFSESDPQIGGTSINNIRNDTTSNTVTVE